MGSFYISKLEPIIDNDITNIYPSVDRLKIAQEAFELEESFQEEKLGLVLAYLECYEHTSDILEQQRLIQMIVDEMAKRPRLNLSGSHFHDSYLAEIECLKQKTRLVRQVIDMLISQEFKENSQIREYLEKTYRLLQD